MKLEPEQQKKIFRIALCALAGVLILVGAVMLALESGGEQGGTGFYSGVSVPDNELLVSDIYEGETLIPKFELPENKYDMEKFKKGEDGYLRYDDWNARLGVDVSEYQGDVDWNKVKEAGIDFAILRLGYRGMTQGFLNVDETFEQNFQGATDAGLFVGVYFFSQAVSEAEARAEADFVIETLDGRKLAYPVMFDWEQPTASSGENLRASHVKGDEAARYGAVFCERIKEAGYRPAVYTNKYLAYEFFDLSQWKDYDLWYAEYQDVPSMHYDFRMWQYTDCGQVPGIEGGVDMNICFKPY